MINQYVVTDGVMLQNWRNIYCAHNPFNASETSRALHNTESICFLAALKAIKTYIRTKSGKLVERVVFLSKDDYEKFTKGGGDASDVLKKYLTKEEANNLDSWDKEEVPNQTSCPKKIDISFDSGDAVYDHIT